MSYKTAGVASCVLVLGLLSGCGNLQEVFVDAARTAAKDAIDREVDEFVGDLIDVENLGLDELPFEDDFEQQD
ncbi:MAG: hypothetical protein ACPGXK_09080 [Phycisphaerae bacterium]